MPYQIMHVAEKPSVARQLVPHLAKHGTIRQRNNATWNTVEFQRSWPSVGVVPHVMTSVRGHLLSIDFVEEFRKWYAHSPIRCLDAQIQTYCEDDMKNVLDNLQKIARRSKMLVLWTDCDREGEHIGWEIQNVCREVNRNIVVKRAQFSCCTRSEVQKAIRSLRPIHMGMVDAVVARSELDLRLGAAFTRFQTLLMQSKYSDVGGVVSYGSCQLPTLGFVADRQDRIDNFIAENFWTLELEYREDQVNTGEETPETSASSANSRTRPALSNNTHHSAGAPGAIFSWKRNRLFHRVACLALFEECVAAQHATVVKAVRRPRTKRKPVPLCTIAMTKVLSRSRRMTAKRIQDTAERLYSKGILSYPRTETEVFRPDFDLRALIAHQAQSPQWGGFAQRLNAGDFEQPRAGAADDNAHPPIHPLKFVDPASLNDQDERNVYEFVVRHFLACCSKDAKGSGVDLEVEIGHERFTTSGLAIEERNYLEVYIYEKWTNKSVPDLREGDVFAPSRLEMKEQRTRPPPYLSEADLISLMEKHGIGTDATMGQHIEKIKERQYVVEFSSANNQQPRLKCCKLGAAIIKAYSALDIAFGRPRIRQQMELDSKAIEQGRKTKDIVVAECIEMHRKLYRRMESHRESFEEALDRVLADAEGFDALGENEPVVLNSIGKCGDCNSVMCLKEMLNEGRGNKRYLMWCNECRLALVLPPGQVSDAKSICEVCRFGKVTVTMARGNNWSLCPKCRSESHAKITFKVARCPSTRGGCSSTEMCVGKNNYGGWELTCSGSGASGPCDFRSTMPKAVHKISMPAIGPGQSLPRLCSRCKILPKLNVELKGRLPPGVDHQMRRCLKCDEDLRELSGYWWNRGSRNSGGVRGGNTQNQRNVSNNARSNIHQYANHQQTRSKNAQSNTNTRSRSTRSSSRSRSSGARSTTITHKQAIAAGSAAPRCPKCQGMDAIRLTSNSEKNPGREFWKCGHPECKAFIAWVDEQKENSVNSSGTGSRHGSTSGQTRTKRQRVTH